MIIDIHTHAWPQKVSLKAKESLESLFKVRLIGDPTIETLISHMDKHGVDISVVCAVASRPEQVVSINDWLLSARSQRLKVFCAMHPDYPDWEKELRRLKAKGDGVKFQPEFQNFYVDDKRVFPLYELMQELGLPVLFHCGEELSGTMLVRSSPERILSVKENFPRLTLIAAHFGGFRMLEKVKEYLLGKDIFMDTSFFFPFLKHKKEARELLMRHDPEKLLFGTDFPLVEQSVDIRYIESLKLPRSLMENIFYRNAAGILGIKC